MSEQPAISLEHVGKTFSMALHLAGGIKSMVLKPRESLRRMRSAQREVLRDITLEVARGESVALLGRNGAGKSTLLAMIAGVIRPTSGSVVVRGRVSPLLELGAGFHPELTGRDNVLLNGVLLGMHRDEVRRKFDAIVAFAELEDSIDEPLRVYSSGMQARLGFAVAAHLEPEILLIDEAMSVGDAAFQAKCFAKIEELHRLGVTAVVVTHDTKSLARFCQRAFVIENHGVAFAGAAEDAAAYYRRDAG